MSDQEFCSACPVTLGQCPQCGTFWLPHGDGKRYGVRLVDRYVGGPTTGQFFLGQLPNVVRDGFREANRWA